MYSKLLYGNRVTKRMSLHNVEHVESEELDRQMLQIMHLIGVQYSLPGFTKDDVDQLLDTCLS